MCERRGRSRPVLLKIQAFLFDLPACRRRDQPALRGVTRARALPRGRWPNAAGRALRLAPVASRATPPLTRPSARSREETLACAAAWRARRGGHFRSISAYGGRWPPPRFQSALSKPRSSRSHSHSSRSRVDRLTARSVAPGLGEGHPAVGAADVAVRREGGLVLSRAECRRLRVCTQAARCARALGLRPALRVRFARSLAPLSRLASTRPPSTGGEGNTR